MCNIKAHSDKTPQRVFFSSMEPFSLFWTILIFRPAAALLQQNRLQIQILTSLETDLSLLFFQFCFRLFYFVDKHLSHLFLFTLQVPQELFPLGLVCLLKTGGDEKTGQSENRQE